MVNFHDTPFILIFLRKQYSASIFSSYDVSPTDHELGCNEPMFWRFRCPPSTSWSKRDTVAPTSQTEGRLDSGHLKRFTLEGDDCPPFVATSYVWGDPAETAFIQLNGRHAEILKNAYTFFESMMSADHCEEFPPSTTWWWIDCICINQDDPAERSSQVGLMSTIYKRAKQTIIWLGTESENSDIAIGFLNLIAKDFTRAPGDENFWTKQIDIANHLRGWKAVENLLTRKWWERVWTIQEFLLGRYAVSLCGKKRISVRRMACAIHGIWEWHQFNKDIISRESYEKAWNRIRLLEWYTHSKPGSHLSLVAIMTYTATFSVTDPRDRIYSLLGIVSPADLDVVGRPDYESDTRVVYTRYTMSFINKYRTLDLVCLAPELRTDLQPGQDENALVLPSWVPDWSLRRNHSPPVLCMASQSANAHIGNFRPLHPIEFSCSYRASAFERPDVSLSDDGLEMTCSGIYLDDIDGLGGGEPELKDLTRLVQSTSSTNVLPNSGAMGSRRDLDRERLAECSSILDQVSRCLTLDRLDPYLSRPAPRYEFAREFQRIGRMAIGGEDRAQTTAANWFRLNKGLQIKDISLEHALLHGYICSDRLREEDLADKVKQLVKGATHKPDDYGNPGNRTDFLSRFRNTTLHRGKRLIVTKTGLLGMAPKIARKWDVLYVLLGCNLPMVLRPLSRVGYFKVVGECYVDGYMNGQAVEEVNRGTRKIQKFRLV